MYALMTQTVKFRIHPNDRLAIFMHRQVSCEKWLNKRMGFMEILRPWHSESRKIATSSSDGRTKLFYEDHLRNTLSRKKQ